MFFLLLISFSSALGVSPGKATFDFEPGKQIEFDVLLVNSRNIPVDIGVSYTGVASDSFKATTPSVPARGSAVATVSFVMPDDIPPGNNRHTVRFEEFFFDPEAGGLSAKTAVILGVYIWKPYPGKYAEIRLEPRNVREGENSDIKVTVYSRGDQPISGDIEVRVKDSQDKLIDLLLEPDFSLDANSDKYRYLQVPSADWPAGIYYLEGKYDYGAAVASTQSRFIIGTKNISVVNVTRDYYLDKDANRFDIDILSLWNDPIEHVSGELTLGSSNGKTPSITLAPFSEKTLTGYWPSDNKLKEGEHLALVTVTFDGGEVSVPFSVNVYNNSPVISQEQEPGDVQVIYLTDILALAILLLIIGYFSVNAWRRHSRR